MPNDPFGAVRTGFHYWGNQLQVATAPHRRKFADFAVGQAIDALPQGPVQKAAKLFHEGYKRQRDWREYEAVDKRSRTMPNRRFRPRMSRSRALRRRFARRPSRFRRRIPRRIPTMWEPARTVKMKAVYTTTNAGTSGSLVTYQVSGINVLDPFLGVSAQQCLGSDQWASLYTKCKVLGTDVKFIVHNKGTTAVIVGIAPIPESNATPVTTWDQYSEFPGCVKKMLSPDDDTCNLWKRMNTRRWMKIRNLKDETDVACTFPTTGPTRDYDINCFIQSMDKSTTNAVELLIEVTYTVYLYDRIIPSRS